MVKIKRGKLYKTLALNKFYIIKIMKYTIDIRIVEGSEPSLCPIYYDEENNTCALGLTISDEAKIEEILSKENAIKLLIKELASTKLTAATLFDENIIIIEKILSENPNVLSCCDSISFVADREIKEYIDKNPILKKYNMHLNGNHTIDSKSGNELYSLFGEYENVYLLFDGNKTERHIREYKSTIDAIDDIVKTINKYNLSPLEKIMYAYDLVRDRVYTKESENESNIVSRDLSSVLFGNKIVCAGYVAIFNSVLKNLGINVMDYIIARKDNNKKGHVRSLVYVNDKKYNVNGIFLFDPTWDSKKYEGDKSYLTSYRFFCKSKDEFRYFDQEYNNVTLPNYSKNFTPRVKKIIETDGLLNITPDMAKTFNDISILVDNKSLANGIIFNEKVPKELRNVFASMTDTQELIKSLDRFQSLFFGQTLNPLTLLEVLYNVRKVQYYEEPEKYPFDTESIKKAVSGSSMIDSKLLHALFGLPEKLTNEEFDNWKEENNLERNIEGIKLTRKLRTILENK